MADTYQLGSKNITAQLRPVAEREHREIIIGLDPQSSLPIRIKRGQRKLTSIPSFLNLAKIEFGPLQIVLF